MAKYQVGVILDSVAAHDIYRDSTGQVVPPMPEGKNTLRIPFRLRDESGVERAALLIQQQGFVQTAEEVRRGEEVNGLSVLVATDAPADAGEKMLSALSAETLGL